MIAVTPGPPAVFAEGQVVYETDDHSWAFRPSPGGTEPYGGRSIGLGTIQVELDQSGRLHHAWGYHPPQLWEPFSGEPAPMQRGTATVDVPDLADGTSQGFWPTAQGRTQIDRLSGWVRIGRLDRRAGATFVEFASRSVVELDETELVALWLRPLALPPGHS